PGDHDPVLGDRRAGQPCRRPPLHRDRSPGQARLMAAAAAVSLEQIDWENPEQIGLWQDAWQRFRRNPIAVGGLVFRFFLVLDALLAPLLGTFHIIADPLKQQVTDTYAGFSLQHPL